MPANQHFKMFDFGVSSLTFPGQSECGDLYIAKEIPNGALIGVIDGIGHGSQAACAANLALQIFNAYTEKLSIIAAVRMSHDKLKQTRGVVMALASINFNDETITWLSIGNVEGILLRADPIADPVYESIIMRPGVVGYNLPPLYASVVPISKGDLLIFSTDGIRDDYIPRIAAAIRYANQQLLRSEDPNKLEPPDETIRDSKDFFYSIFHLENNGPTLFRGGNVNFSTQKLADYICRRFAKGSDDALVAVARYLGKK